ncbi:hypothetical protein [Companilactobacillus mishanensis]|uniref:hypothetical protein n=1 Tax=Companilactobacillus mishanensis TaxID=2486008 RepID=UPI001295688F|nr:hypothetical protein [Companilactobacillus mishanensis]MQS88255.1 hypothetical protein [Companilactobacillus mishanensis]
MAIVLSIIGCITGVASLVVQGMNLHLSLPKVTAVQSSRYDSYWIDGTSLESIKSKSPLNDFDEIATKTYVSIISMQITNKSAYPITINEIKKINSGTKEITSDSFNPLIDPANKVMFCEKPLELPIRINPYDSLNGSIAFFDVIGGSGEIKSEKFKINTSYKTFFFTFDVKSVNLLSKEEQKQHDELTENRNASQKHGKDL